MLLKGFLFKGPLSVADLELLIWEMRGIVHKYAGAAYKNLVSRQIERIVDDIAIGEYKQPDDHSIFDIAVQEVKRKISYAENRMNETEYNFYIGVQVMTGKIDGNPVAYFKVIAPNDIYSRHLKKIPDLIPYDINEDDLDAGKEKAELWGCLSDKYSVDIPLSANLILHDEVTIDIKEMKFRTPQERAKDIAKEKILNHLLSAYGCGEQIQPNRLMEYIGQSIGRLNYGPMKMTWDVETKTLTNLLPEITEEIVFKNNPEKKEDA